MSYGFSSEFASEMLATVVQDVGFGYRVAQTVDPSQIKAKVRSVIMTAIQQYTRENGSVPERRVLRELVCQQNHKGVLRRKDLKKYLNAIDRAFSTIPIPRKDVKDVLDRALLDVEIKQVLDEGWVLYKNRQYNDFFLRVDQARVLPSRLDLGGKGINFRRDLDSYINRISSGDARVVRYPVGVSTLDPLIKGGLGRGELGCILGPEKGGKSMALSHIAATSLMLGLSVVYFSFELAELDIENRISANLTNMLTDSIEVGGREVSIELASKLRPILDATSGNLVVKSFPPKAATVQDAEMYIRDVVIREYGITPDVLIFDYADEMKASSDRYSGENTYLQMGDIYSAIRALGAPPDSSLSSTGGFNCVVWTASQVQRAALGKELLEFKDVADSIRKAAIVDLMLALCQDENEAEVNQHRLFITLCRFAPGFKEVGPYRRDYEHGRLIKFDEKVRRFEASQWQRLVRRSTAPMGHLIAPTRPWLTPRLTVPKISRLMMRETFLTVGGLST